MKQERISNGKIEAFFCRPEHGESRKAVILLGGSNGGFFSDKYHNFVEQLVSAGYVVLDLAYFRAGSLPVALKRIPLEYFESAIEWLSKQPEVVRDRYAAIGVSKGGELALLLASRYKEFKAVSAIVPSHVVFQGLGLPRIAGSSWTYKGQDLPCVPFAWAPWLLCGYIGTLTMHFRYLYTASLRKAGVGGDALIPVERIAGPVQFISATKDTVWPSTEMCDLAMQRLDAYGFPHHHEHKALEAPHWALAKKECRLAVTTFLANHFSPGAA